MEWAVVRQHFPDKWIVGEALKAHFEDDRKIIEHLTVIDCFDGCEGNLAIKHYAELHRQWPTRDIFFFHTAREIIEIQESHWPGIRGRQ